MKICIDVRLLTKGGTSGIEEYTRNLMRSLLALGSGDEYYFFYNGFRKAALDFSGTIVDWRVPNKLLDASMRFLNWPKLDRLVPADVLFSPHFNIVAS